MASVAVIGLGACGLVTVKNLLEEGFEVIGFERNPYIGGLWHYTPKPSVSALETTVVNISRERCCFTDFPFNDDASSYPTAAEVDKYLREFTEHFKLWPHLKLNTQVSSIRRDDVEKKWVVESKTDMGAVASQSFDKVVVTTGQYLDPIVPKLTDEDKFKGEILHSAAFKQPKTFQNRKVLVVGIGNSAVDTATILVDIASSVYLSHRGGCLLLPRLLKNGKSFDHEAKYRTFMIRDVLESLAPTLANRFVDKFLQDVQNKRWDLQAEWRLAPTPSLIHMLPTVSDNFVDGLKSGKIKSMAAPKRVIGDYEVELEDGSVVETDTVIWCTGYSLDYSVLGPYDPTLSSSDAHTNPDHTNRLYHDRPRLYQNILSLEHPESLAFVGAAVTYLAAFHAADLSAMAITQVWKHPERLPSKKIMQSWYEDHLQWSENVLKTGKFIPKQVQFGSWTKWVEEAAGTNVSMHLGYGLTGWKFWLQDRTFCNLLMDGIYSPHVFRLFPGDGRKVWSGARSAIEKVNREVEERTKTGTLISTSDPVR